MKIGDMVLDPLGDTAILLSVPRLSEECRLMLDGPDMKDCYVADVLLTEFGCKDVWITDDLEIIDENW